MSSELSFIRQNLRTPLSSSESESAHQHLRRQQERDLMQKARLLTDENSVSFQLFLRLLSSITLCSENLFVLLRLCGKGGGDPVFKEGRSNT